MKKLIAILCVWTAVLLPLPALADWPDTASGGGHTIEDEATPLAQRSNLNFTGAGVTAADSGGKTVVTIPGGSGSTELDQSAGETDLRYDATEECYYLDVDGSGTRASSEAEQCIDGTTDGTFSSDDRKLYCNPIAFERNGTTTTRGIQECVDAVGAYGGGTVLLGPRIYSLTGSAPIVIDEGDTGEVNIVGAGKGATVIRCNTGDGCTATAVIQIRDDRASLSGMIVSTDIASNNVIEIGNASNYVEKGAIRDVFVSGPGGTAGSRTGNGIVLAAALQYVIQDVQIENASNCTLVAATAAGRVNAITFRNADMVNCDEGLDTGVGGFSANTGDSQGLVFHGGTIQSMFGYGIHLRGGSSDTTNFNSVTLFGTYVEGMDSAVKVDGSSSAYDPNVIAYGLDCSSMADSAWDADSDTDCIVTDSDSAGTTIIALGGYYNSVQCITHNAAGVVLFGGLYNSGSPCDATAITGSATERDLMNDTAFKDEAATITGAWDASGGRFEPPTGTAFPGSPATNEIFVVTDDSAIGACDSAAGSARSLCRWNGSAWQSLGDGGGGGGIGGSTGATDNRLLRADGTGGATVQNSAITVDDNGNMTIPSTGSIDVTGNSTAGQAMTLKEDTDNGSNTFKFDLGSVNLGADVAHTPDTAGEFDAETIIQDNSVDDGHLDIVENACSTLYVPGSTIADTYDVTSVWEAFQAVTITRVWCETDTGTVTMDVQIDDGTPADVMGTDLTCDATGEVDTTSLTGSMADGDRLDWAITSVASSPVRLTVCVEYTR